MKHWKTHPFNPQNPDPIVSRERMTLAEGMVRKGRAEDIQDALHKIRTITHRAYPALAEYVRKLEAQGK